MDMSFLSLSPTIVKNISRITIKLALVFVALLPNGACLRKVSVPPYTTVILDSALSAGRETFRASLRYYPLKRGRERITGFIRQLVPLAILF